jgi:hypothetical protein
MDFIENNFRDANGRLLPGHGGLKPKGATNRLQGEIKEKITLFLSGKLETLEEIYSEVSPKDKLHFLGELLAYVLPKSKELKIEGNTGETTARINYLALKESSLRDILQNTTNTENDNT